MYLSTEAVRALTRKVDAWGALWPGGKPGPTTHAQLERALAVGMDAFKAVEASARRVATMLEFPATVEAYDLDSARKLESLLAAWLRPADVAIDRVASIQSDGSTVVGADDYKRAVLDARVAVSFPVDRVATDIAHGERLTGIKAEGLRHAVQRRVERLGPKAP